jgi:predicted 3-demethylubiquinone-9 3-methyltransferase (glyoxalase superfamily)
MILLLEGRRIGEVLKDKFGLSWQIVPKVLSELLNDPDSAKSQRAFQAIDAAVVFMCREPDETP